MEFEEELGYGSFGTVYRVSFGGKTYALKQIRIPYENGSNITDDEQTGSSLRDDAGKMFPDEAEDCTELSMEDAENIHVLEPFLREIRILQRLADHPNIVSLADYKILRTDQSLILFILMECLEPLSEYETAHAMEEAEVIRLGTDLCHALDACEKEGILHRDLKIDNILVSPDGTFKLCDFGEARDLEKTIFDGSVKGTFSFMAPEVYHGKKYDQRADIYSLGLLLYRCVNKGRGPFLPADLRMASYQDKEEALNRRMNGEELPPPADASEELFQILQKACAYYPDKRYATAMDLSDDLEKLQKGTYRHKKKRKGSFGKRTKAFYRKAAVTALACIAAAGFGGRAIAGLYREYFVNYCDPVIIEKLEEDYGVPFEGKLNGNGVLTLQKNSDLYCTRTTHEYPWMNEKNRIRKIVFAGNVTRLSTNNTVEFDDQGAAMQQGPTADDTFQYCKNLEEVTIKSKDFVINGINGFLGAEKLSCINSEPDARIRMSNVPFGDTPWYSEEGYRILGDTLVRYNGTQEQLTDIPENISVIGEMAFSDNKGIKSVSLPESIVQICEDAFSGCSGLETVELKNGVTSILSCAFRDCTSLDHLTIPASVEFINEDVFHGCSGLQDLKVDPGNTIYQMTEDILYNVEQKELVWCSPGKSGELAIADDITKISAYAFFDASGVTKIIFPDHAEGMNCVLFGTCPNLNEVIVSPANSLLTMEDTLLYDKEKTQLLFCPRGREGSVTVADGIQVISEKAFAGCEKLTGINLPDTTAFLMGYAFEDCSSLRQIQLPASMHFIASNVFIGCTSLTDIYYQGTQEAWEALVERFDTGIDPERTKVHFGEEP